MHEYQDSAEGRTQYQCQSVLIRGSDPDMACALLDHPQPVRSSCCAGLDPYLDKTAGAFNRR